MQAIYRADGESIPYTPVAAVSAGQVVVLGNDLVAIAKLDIAAGELGCLATTGRFDGVKDASVFAVGDSLYWDADGNPVGGVAGSGAFSSDPAVGPYSGQVLAAALTGGATVDFRLLQAPATNLDRMDVVAVAATGSAQGDAAALTENALNTVSAADGTKGTKLPAAATGAKCSVYNEHASNGLKIYPGTSDDINDGTANAAITIEGKTRADFVAVDATTWTATFTANT
jgi:predicted RecA/RadA family phage recombinase